jgi:23S rRNA (uridine2552-2'-O)-methyltransferase
MNVSQTRNKAVLLKKGTRKHSSHQWLTRQLNDPYVTQAKLDGYRSRAAYKILEIHEKFKLFEKGMNVVDLGAAPGGWSQVAAKLIGSKGVVVAIDLLEIDPIAGVSTLQMDFCDPLTPSKIMQILGAQSDVVMSDMAANATGHAATDHLRIIDLCERSFAFAEECLKPGGSFIAKILRGGLENTLLTHVKQKFSVVKHFKPKSSRTDSKEIYLVAMGFKSP